MIVIFLIKISLHSLTLHKGPYGSVLLRKGKIACTWFFVAGFCFFFCLLFVFFNFLLINTVEYLLFLCLFAALTSIFLFIAENSCLRPIDRNGKLLCPGKSFC